MHDLLIAFPVRLETLNNQIIGESSQQFFQLFVSFFSVTQLMTSTLLSEYRSHAGDDTTTTPVVGDLTWRL